MTHVRMRWWRAAVMAVFLVLGGAMGAQAVEHKKAASGASKAPKEEVTAVKLIASLDAILEEQEQLKAAIESVRREAEIVKIRATTCQ